jgi:hypothetical protein
VSAADRSPVPLGALAIKEPIRETERTGTHPTVAPEGKPAETAGAEVMPLPHSAHAPEELAAPEPEQGAEQPVGAAEATGSAPEREPPAAQQLEAGQTAASVPPRPPVLASEVLREDIEPTEPGRTALRLFGAIGGASGAAATLAIGGLDPAVLGVAASLALVAGLSAAPVRYAVRASGVLVLALAGLAGATALRLVTGAAPESPVLAVGAVVLAGGLLFRARYRASWLARVTSGVGMCLVMGWFVLAGGVDGFAHISTEWSGWAPILTRAGFGLLLLLSLLAFMGSNSTGGSGVWAAAVLIWYAVQLGVQTAAAMASSRGVELSSYPNPAVSMIVAAPLLAALGAMALAQGLAALSGGTAESRSGRSDSSAPGPGQEQPAGAGRDSLAADETGPRRQQ